MYEEGNEESRLEKILCTRNNELPSKFTLAFQPQHVVETGIAEATSSRTSRNGHRIVGIPINAVDLVGFPEDTYVFANVIQMGLKLEYPWIILIEGGGRWNKGKSTKKTEDIAPQNGSE